MFCDMGNMYGLFVMNVFVKYMENVYRHFERDVICKMCKKYV